ncbi:MAG: hemolysin family protein [Deltaproteobacteria bacterium]|nr:hemolysin family protein [Deltaproteobacteria bacterium]
MQLPTSLGLHAVDVAVFVACLVVAAIFSAAETALFALSDARVQEIVKSAKEKRQRVRSLLRYWVDAPDHVLTAILLGKHTAHVALVMAVCLALDDATVPGPSGPRDLLQNPLSAFLAAFVLVNVIVVVELFARAFAKQKADSVAPLVFPVVVVAYGVFLPFRLVFTRVSHVFARLAGGSVTRSGPFVTEQDIVEMIAMGRRSGSIDKVEGRMLANIIELSDTLVKELMVARSEVSALPIGANYDEVMAEVKEKGHSRVPVFDGTLDDIKGFFHTKDLLTGVIDPVSFKLRDHMRSVEFVPELMRVADLLRLFQKKKTHLAVVVDEFGGTAGVVALEDVLEEIVGPIHDEHDEVDAPIRKMGETRWVAEGRVSLYELGETLHVTFPDGGYETLGGFLIARCGRMPRKGDRVSFQGYTFLVTEADERKVSTLEIEKNPIPLITAGDVVTVVPEVSHTSGEGDPVVDPDASGPMLAAPGPDTADNGGNGESKGADASSSSSDGATKER